MISNVTTMFSDRHIQFLIDFDASAGRSILHCGGDPTIGNMVVVSTKFQFAGASDVVSVGHNITARSV